MTSLRGPGLRDIRVLPASKREAVIDIGSLFGVKKELDPSNPGDLEQIRAVAQGYAQGAYDDEQMNRFIEQNPIAGTVLAPIIAQTRLQKDIASRFSTPERQIVSGPTDDQMVTYKPGGFDYPGAANAAIASGNKDLANTYLELYKKSPKSLENTVNTVQQLYGSGGTSPRDITAKISSTGDTSFEVKPGDITYQNTGTHLIPTVHGVPIPGIQPIPINVSGKAQAESTGSAAGAGIVKKELEKPKDLTALEDIAAKSDAAIDAAQAVLSHPGIDLASGKTFFLGSVPGTSAYDASQSLETLKGQIMLSVLQAFRNASSTGSSGFGQLSNTEGETLRNSVANLNRAQTTKQLKSSLQNVIETLQGSKDRAMRGYMRLYNERPDIKPYHTNPSTPEAPAVQESKTIGNKTYIKINGKWFEK